jgi:hypothetical protein
MNKNLGSLVFQIFQRGYTSLENTGLIIRWSNCKFIK